MASSALACGFMVFAAMVSTAMGSAVKSEKTRRW